MFIDNESAKILPAFQNHKIAIVFESSDVYIPYMCVAIKSILNHINPNTLYDLIILSNEIENDHECEFQKMCEDMGNVSIRVFNPDMYVQKYIKRDKYNYLRLNFYRLALPWILSEYDMAINLGADILVCKDLVALYDISFEKNEYLAGARDLGYLGRLEVDIPLTELNLQFPEHYVNADVLVYNLSAIRKNYDQDWIMNIWQKEYMRCSEQDALNIIFNQHMQILDLRWNVFAAKMNSEQDILRNTNADVMEWKNSLNDPFIIHYAAVPKPWDYPLVGSGDYWWSVAKQTIYYEEILRRMCINAVMESVNTAQAPTWRQKLFNKFCPAFSRRWRVLNKIFPKGSFIRKVVRRIVVGKK